MSFEAVWKNAVYCSYRGVVLATHVIRHIRLVA